MMKLHLIVFLVISILCIENTFSQAFPDTEWKQNSFPVFSGWDQEGLDVLLEYVIDSTATTGMMLIHNGEVVFEYGNIVENSYIASCRKSILAILYGKYVRNGTINLNSTLEDLKIDGDGLLLKSERQVTIKDIISSRSGIFLPSANGGDLSSLAPKRGSYKPGDFWLYNNWDFNMAGYIFEKETHKNIYDEVESQLAIPLQMQDWDKSLQEKDGDKMVTDIMPYHMWFSTRDMARMGWLMLNNGNWRGKQVIEKEWIKEITTPKTSLEEVDKIAPFFKENGGWFGYGYMWWIWQKKDNEMLKGAFTASGAYGQNITMFPEMNTVLVIKTNDVYERQKGDHNYIIDKITKIYSSELEKEFSELAIYLKEDNISLFLSTFEKKIDRNNTQKYQDELNKIGYYYLRKKEYEKAIEVFKFNIKLHPNVWNLYDSLGEAYFSIKDYNNALKQYEKAFELNTESKYYKDRGAVIIKRIESKMK